MKKIIFNILCNAITGYIIVRLFNNRIPNIRYSGYRFAIANFSEKRLAATIFFGFYESAEIRFVEKFFHGDINVIELGASSGVLSTHILKKMEDKASQLVSVEANEMLRSVWNYNVSQCSSASSATLMNSAVFYGADVVRFTVSHNSTESRISNDDTDLLSHITVPAISLSAIAQKYNFNEYALFCDIEGAECQIFTNESVSTFTKCKHLFIELHDTSNEDQLWTVEDLHELVLSKGFDLIERHGPVCYYQNRTLKG